MSEGLGSNIGALLPGGGGWATAGTGAVLKGQWNRSKLCGLEFLPPLPLTRRQRKACAAAGPQAD